MSDLKELAELFVQFGLTKQEALEKALTVTESRDKRAHELELAKLGAGIKLQISCAVIGL